MLQLIDNKFFLNQIKFKGIHKTVISHIIFDKRLFEKDSKAFYFD